MLTRSKEKHLTGVGATLKAEHRSRAGEVHAHIWEITAWFYYDPSICALTARYDLEQVLKSYQGKCLPDRIAWGEDLAAEIARSLASEYRTPIQVDVVRHEERIYAKWASS